MPHPLRRQKCGKTLRLQRDKSPWLRKRYRRENRALKRLLFYKGGQPTSRCRGRSNSCSPESFPSGLGYFKRIAVNVAKQCTYRANRWRIKVHQSHPKVAGRFTILRIDLLSRFQCRRGVPARARASESRPGSRAADSLAAMTDRNAKSRSFAFGSGWQPLR
jgi:hypothetical protein